MKKILAFSGSNSSYSINQKLIKIVCRFIQNCDVEIIDLRDYATIMFSVDEEMENGIPEIMITLRDKMQAVDGFLIATPEHNGSIPAFFKNILDWQSRQGTKLFLEKPVVFLSTSPGSRGGASALNHLLEIMPHRGAKIIGGHAVKSFGEAVIDGILTNTDDERNIKDLLQKLVKAI